MSTTRTVQSVLTVFKKRILPKQLSLSTNPLSTIYESVLEFMHHLTLASWQVAEQIWADVLSSSAASTLPTRSCCTKIKMTLSERILLHVFTS